MKTEIETRFLEINKNHLIVTLQALGAADKGEVKLDEIIFYDKYLTWMKDGKLVKIRRKGDDIKLIFKNNKEKTIEGVQEIEFKIPNIAEVKSFLEAIGLIAYRTIEKYRHSFELDGAVIDIDTWPKIPVYVEIEGDSAENVKGIAEKLGFNWEDRFDGDPRVVFKKYGFDLDKIRTVTFDTFE